MKYSIIIPVYNVEKYLNECLESILAQTYEDYEIILVDDGSTDSSGMICDAYAKSNSFIKCFHKKNEGQSAARNHGISLAKGEYLIFVDSDDLLADRTMLEKIESACSGADIIAFNWTEFSDGETPNEKKAASELAGMNSSYPDGVSFLLEALNENPLYEWYAWRYAIRTDYWKERNFSFPHGKKYEDVALMYKVIAGAKKIFVLDEALYCYRTSRPGSTVTSVNINIYRDGLNVIVKNICEVREKRDFSPELKRYLCNNFSCLYYAFLIQSSRIENKEERQMIWKKLKECKWVCAYTTEKRQRLVYRVLKIIGIQNTARLLGLRRKLQILSGKKKA